MISYSPTPPDAGLKLWYQQAATQWEEALPLGNGRLGAMLWGEAGCERLQLNEDTFWTGSPYDPNNPESLRLLPQIRELVWQGQSAAAHEVAEKMMARPLKQMNYQPVGDLLIKMESAGEVENYRRELDLETAIARVSFQKGGVCFEREAFCSAPDGVLVVRLCASQPGQLSFRATLNSPQPHQTMTTEGDALCLSGQPHDYQGIESVLRFACRVQVRAQGGTVRVENGEIRVENADSALIFLDIATNFKAFNDTSGEPESLVAGRLERAMKRNYDDLKARHIADYRALFARVSLELGGDEASQIPTDERLKQNVRDDSQLAALYFQFGRYLLIASSRAGSQPANLQGIWNDKTAPPWDSKWTININAQMNYWPAEVCNLSELHAPLFDLIRDLAHTGQKTARVHYDARGWVAHHNTDIWRAAAPMDGPKWGMWPLGGAWLCTHLWDHFQFSGDENFLRQCYPILHDASLFFVDFLVKHPQRGWMVTNPSMSPEHGGLVAGPTMDNALVRDLFEQTAQASEILGLDADFRMQITELCAQLPPFQIGKHGQLQEWLEDKDDPANDHRHVAHLYAVFPSCQISERTPELLAAARRSLEFRGDGGTGWSKAWKINFWARFQDGDHAHKMLCEALERNTYPNLFNSHPPFQIDGNFGGTSGIAEMLLQSQNGEIHLLPALPTTWPSGEVRGLRARGGFEVDIAWKSGQLQSATISSSCGAQTRVRIGKTTREITVPAGESVHLNGELCLQAA